MFAALKRNDSPQSFSRLREQKERESFGSMGENGGVVRYTDVVREDSQKLSRMLISVGIRDQS